MEYLPQWKSFFPIGTFSPLLRSEPQSLGPLLFNPEPNSEPLFSSPSLVPPLHLPPLLLPSRFLLTSEPYSISTASSLPLNDAVSSSASHFTNNRLHLLTYPNRPVALVFFPTGTNDDKLGFFVLSVRDSNLRVHLDGNGDVFRADIGSSSAHHRILKISVNPASDLDSGNDDGTRSPLIGYLLATTLYSVHWFSVRHNSVLDRPVVFYAGGKVFKTCPVVHACWSPHILEESVVMLESGQLFLFDLELGFKGTRLKVPWNDDDSGGSSENLVWLSCEFSWHPRILVVARSDTIFLVDLRSKECCVSCLMKIEALRMFAPDQNENFLALSSAGPDRFYFAVASTHVLLVLDVRKSMIPVLQWMHDMDDPCYITVFSLSVLRSHSKEDTFKQASESGFCIVLGSFWNSEFNLFCYGPEVAVGKGSIASKLSKIEKTFNAWEFPSEIKLSSRNCRCGSCLLREELSKDALPEWVDWQLTEEMVLGFGILSNDLAALLCEQDEHGGFTLIRLMSSGKFELQRYHASWHPARNFCHEQELCLGRHLLYTTSEEKYKFPKIFHYLRFDYLYAYASGNLTELLTKKLEKMHERESYSIHAQEKEPCAEKMHEFLCEKLNACGFGRLRSSPATFAVFEDVKLPASFHEVALRRLWADMPLGLLQLAFLKYSDSKCHEVLDQNTLALDSFPFPDLPHLPPFFLRKSSSENKFANPSIKYRFLDGKVKNDGECSTNERDFGDEIDSVEGGHHLRSPQPFNYILGPVTPLPVLVVLNELYNGCSDLEGAEFSVEAELGLKYNEVMQVASDIAVSTNMSNHLDDHAVSLANDVEETWDDPSKSKTFLSYRPVAFNCSATNVFPEKSGYSDKVYETFIFHVQEKSSEQTEPVGQEMFDDLCPVKLRFDAPVKKFEPEGLKAYHLLKKQMSKWQQSFGSYKEFCSQSRFEV